MELKNIVEICVAIDIAILGIAYPIIIDKISNIGNRYNSNYLSNVFEQEFPQISYGWILPFRSRKITTFEWLLFFTIISFSFLIIDAEPWIWEDSFFMRNSAKILTLSLTIFLVIFFIIWLDKIALYSGKPTRLLLHLIRKYKKGQKDEENYMELINALNEFAYFAVEKEDVHLQEVLSTFYTEEFIKIRSKHDSIKPLEYPFYLYQVNHQLIKKLRRKSIEELDRLTGNAVSNWWLLGQDYQEIPISEKTYDHMWGNVVLISDNAKLIKQHWSTAHQYFRFQLESKRGVYSLALHDYENKKEIEIRENEKIRFLEFHYALGGLLLYRKNENGLKRILNFTQSQPPVYYLLPGSMYEIFYWFAYFKEGYLNRVTPTDFKYPFPDIDNLGLSREITSWICQYICLLFIRQFFLQPQYSFERPTEQPKLPETVLELLKWKEGLSYFRYCFTEIKLKEGLLDFLGYNFNQETAVQMNQLLDSLEERLDNQITVERINAPLSEEKIENFKKSSASIIEKAFKAYDPIINKENFEDKEPVTRFSLNGGSILYHKQGFTENDIPHLNYDSVFAQQIVYDQINRYIPNSFLTAKSRRYLIDKQDIDKVFKRLGFDKERHVIIDFSFWDDGLVKLPDFFNDRVKLHSHVFSNVLFVMAKKDLPRIKHIELKQEEIERLNLIEIIKARHVYSSVIDLSDPENSDLKEKWIKNENQNPDESIQLTIAFLAEIIWKENRDVVQLNITSPLREQGMKTDLSDIKPFRKEGDDNGV